MVALGRRYSPASSPAPYVENRVPSFLPGGQTPGGVRAPRLNCDMCTHPINSCLSSRHFSLPLQPLRLYSPQMLSHSPTPLRVYGTVAARGGGGGLSCCRRSPPRAPRRAPRAVLTSHAPPPVDPSAPSPSFREDRPAQNTGPPTVAPSDPSTPSPTALIADIDKRR